MGRYFSGESDQHKREDLRILTLEVPPMKWPCQITWQISSLWMSVNIQTSHESHLRLRATHQLFTTQLWNKSRWSSITKQVKKASNIKIKIKTKRQGNKQNKTKKEGNQYYAGRRKQAIKLWLLYIHGKKTSMLLNRTFRKQKEPLETINM